MTDWESWRKHVDYVVATRGRWYGLGDRDGTPLFTLPNPIAPNTPEQWQDTPDLELTFPAREPNGDINRLAKLLIMDDLKDFDPSGQLPTAAEDYVILCAFPGKDGQVVRHGGAITHTGGDDPANDGIPNNLTLHALNIGDAWKTIPAISWPISWYKARPYERNTDESNMPYSEPRAMARTEHATNTQFTLKHGPAVFVIGRLAQESIDASGFTQADPDGTLWVDNPGVVVGMPTTDTSPEISLTARDGMLWDTVIGQAQNAGVLLGTRIYWPGDEPIYTWTPIDSNTPPEEVDISPSQGEPTRTLAQRTFPHAMTVLTVKEVK